MRLAVEEVGITRSSLNPAAENLLAHPLLGSLTTKISRRQASMPRIVLQPAPAALKAHQSAREHFAAGRRKSAFEIGMQSQPTGFYHAS